MEFAGQLLIEEAPGERDAVTLTYQGGSKRTGPVRMMLPVHRLARTGFGEALSRKDSAGLGKAAFAYSALLEENISQALGHRLDAGPSSPVLIVVSGAPHVHQWVWEVLRTPEPHAARQVPRVFVVHVLGETGTELNAGRRAERGAELTWIGARPGGKDDLPRYQVLGPVMAEVARESSAIKFAGARSNADRREAELLLRPSASDVFRICHLDVHGKSRMQVGAEGLLVDAEFNFELRGQEGRVAVPDGELIEMLAGFGCDLFATNACFGAQQRSMVEYPLPGLLVQRGIRLAIAAREPLRADAGTIFFGIFYSQLAQGTAVGDAYSAAVADLVQSPLRPASGRPVQAGDWDLAARWAVQPVAWAHSLADLAIRFPVLGDTEIMPRCADYLTVAMRGERISDLFSVIEDNVWSGRGGTEVKPGEGCDLQAPLLEELVAHVQATLTPQQAFPRDECPTTGEPHALEVGQMTIGERFALVSVRFKGPIVLQDLLAHLLPGDIGYLDQLADRALGDAACALLHALSWGPDTVPVPAEHKKAAFSYVERASSTTLLGEGAADAGSIREAMRVFSVINIGVPILALAAPRIYGAPVPAFTEFGNGSSWEIFSGLRMGQLAQDVEGNLFAAPHPWNQLAARQACAAFSIGRNRYQMNEKRPPGETEKNLTWNTGTQWACLSWLAFAAAMRQVGLVDVTAITLTWSIIRAADAMAALLIIKAIEHGIHGWPPIAEGSSQALEKLIEGMEKFDKTYKKWEEESAESSESATLQAVSLLHAGQMESVLAITGPLASSPSPGGPDPEIVKLHAYALAHTGRVGQALAVAKPLIGGLRDLPLDDQCELLHLLADLNEMRGHASMAVRHLMLERELNPPTLHRRVHNRRHLLKALTAARPADNYKLAIQVATEGLALAREVGDTEEIVHFAEDLAWTAFLYEMAALPAVLEIIGDGHELTSSRVVSLARAACGFSRQADADSAAVSDLRALAGGDDNVAAGACYLLGQARGLPEHECIFFLRKGASEGTGSTSYSCARLLFTALWEQNDIVGLKMHAEASLSRRSLLAPAHLALAVTAEVDDRAEAEAAQHLALALALADLTDLAKIMPGILEKFRPAVARLAERILRELLSAHIYAVLAGSGAPEELPLGKLSAVEALDRHARYLAFAGQPGELDLALFRWASDQAWDREDLGTAIVARQHLCNMLAKLAPSARDRLAMETGWLATLLKQRGRITEAETLYQRSIEMGNGIISPVEASSIIGRYANLLHQVGDFDAAVHLQWQAVRARKPHLELPDFPDLKTLNLALTEEGIQDEDASRWALLMANLTNCLKDSGRFELGRTALASVKVALARASRISGDPASDHNLREILRMLTILDGAFSRPAQTVDVASGTPEVVELPPSGGRSEGL